ncbi:MAG: cytochrome c family protein [Nitrospirae bacterium]|nr:cytochrome c family protein [Nitrospirota bacterium]MCL5063272.1 cytochrome c family protein [Nitrospirota bacterium]MDA8214935.1 NapC/NirT family cytochrome c [Nitrospiraceae bacterium]MDA8339594.1 NapC/NirT family cytochrome c [Nitrospiraceae bacterium]
MKKRRDIPDSLMNLFEHLKGFVLAAIVIVAVLGAIVGYRYYRYTQDEPQYCASCHLMKEAFAEWQKGKHRDVICQKCHQLSVLEQNQLLVAFVVKGNQNQPFSQTHGREKPWKACRKCHMDEMTQGSLTLNRSYGHARHVFMQRIDCKICHKGTVHDFHPNEEACQECHQDKGVHGVGMEAFSCLKCHSFSEKTPSMIPKDRCIKCHTNIPKKGHMSDLLCHQCHKPHGEIKPTSATCISECHRNEASVGQHGFHLKKGLECLYCHKAHSWVVGQDRARTVCTKCHSFKDPMLFIY